MDLFMILWRVIFMDINCTHSCFYQQNGKCNLKELPTFTQQSVNNKTDCPYYADGTPVGMQSSDYPNIIA